MRFLSSCQYTHGCYAPASWAARHTTVCLDVGVDIFLHLNILSNFLVILLTFCVNDVTLILKQSLNDVYMADKFFEGQHFRD